MTEVRRRAVSDIRIVPVERVELDLAQRAWPFAVERKSEIASNFAGLRRERPALWNGRVLLLGDHAIRADTFYGSFFETDFASFVAWRDSGFPDAAVKNCFPMGALRTADGAFVLGVMGAHTANAGHVYFPSGTPEPADVVDGRIDIATGLTREIAEETGLTADDFAAETGWDVVLAGPRVALIKVLRAHDRADELAARIRDYLSREAEPELEDIRFVRSPADFDPAMPDFVRAFLMHFWR
jgi:8-oxo-dGTP pyrophosphatase MutT (NUDIX family)